MSNPKPSREAQVYQLVQELEETKLRKKATAKAFGDEIKRINAEIKDLLNPPEEQLP